MCRGEGEMLQTNNTGVCGECHRFPGCAVGTLSQVCHVSPQESWSWAVNLLADIHRAEGQEDLVSNSEPAHNLVEDAISGAKIAPCLLVLAVACLPHFFWWGDGPVYSWLALLWYSLNPLFCEWTRLCLRLELFWGSSLPLSLFVSLAIPQFGLVYHVSSLRLSSGHSGLVLTLSMQPVPPCSPPAHWWRQKASGLLHWELWLGGILWVFFFFFNSWLCCPLRFQNSPQTHW